MTIEGDHQEGLLGGRCRAAAAATPPFATAAPAAALTSSPAGTTLLGRVHRF